MNEKTILFSCVMLICVFASAVSQILLKKTAVKSYEKWWKSYLNPTVILVYGVFFTTTLLNVYSLKYVPLSLSAILEATSYIYIPVLGAIFLHERMNKRKLVGVLTIIIGIIVFAI